MAELLPNVPEGAAGFLEQVKDNRQLVYIIAANVRMDWPRNSDPGSRLGEREDAPAPRRLSRELEVLGLRRKIAEEASER